MSDSLERTINYMGTSDSNLNHTMQTPFKLNRFISALNQAVATNDVVAWKNVEFIVESVGYFTIQLYSLSTLVSIRTEYIDDPRSEGIWGRFVWWKDQIYTWNDMRLLSKYWQDYFNWSPDMSMNFASEKVILNLEILVYTTGCYAWMLDIWNETPSTGLKKYPIKSQHEI